MRNGNRHARDVLSSLHERVRSVSLRFLDVQDAVMSSRACQEMLRALIDEIPS